ncbi:TetR/AcrR family transcriptional regulator [Cupriavidus necator]
MTSRDVRHHSTSRMVRLQRGKSSCKSLGIMGRASRVESARSRERIGQTASRMFAERGVDNVSIAEIMHAAGLTHGGFYNHFASKDALAVEAMQASFNRATEKWNQASTSGGGRKSPLQTMVENYLSIGPASGKCPVVATGYDAIAGGSDELKATFSVGHVNSLTSFRGPPKLLTNPSHDGSMQRCLPLPWVRGYSLKPLVRILGLWKFSRPFRRPFATTCGILRR